ncbi:hypothetical protein FH972_005731 [Carpinus fangiana]|uniref:Uncharacterized protein n=1 Tax=Carpinus fangiana TaxID=176857 RepID=A0A5N6QQI0_9ROSI|nr:hypothetical protein FH972_005731 [Carpinus fangiana]
MTQETNPVEDTHHLFDQMIQPNQKELSLSESIKVKVIPNSICSTNFLKKFCPFTTKFLKKFQHNGKIYHDEDYVFDKMMESKIVLMRDMCWDYEWGVFKIGWKQKTVQQAEIESWSSFVFQYSKEDDVHVVFLKHRWRWKKRMWSGIEGAQLSKLCWFQLRIKISKCKCASRRGERGKRGNKPCRRFGEYIVSGGGLPYQQLCSEIAVEFNDCSKQVLEMESLFLSPDYSRIDLAQLLRAVQAQEKQKLHLTTTIQGVKEGWSSSEP